MIPTIHIKLRTDKIKNDKCAIVFQVYYNKKQKQLFSGYYIEEKYFADGKVVKHPNAAWYNTALRNKYNELEKEYLQQSMTGSIELGENKTISRKDFYSYGEAMFRQKKNKATSDYIMRCIYKLNHFKAFAGEVSFQAITPQLLKDYEDDCFAKGLSRNYINGIFKKLREVFSQAVKEKITDQNPFNLYKPVTYKQTLRTYFSIDEVKQLANAEIDPRLQTIRDFFLFACYTGLRYSDASKIKTVKNKGIERLILPSQKNDEVVSIKVTPVIKEIIKRLKGKKLPSNQKTNEFLKLVGKVAKIEKPITFHVARHSFAVNAASAGIPIEVVARLLGHTSIRTTAIYYKITDSKLDDAMDKIEQYQK